MPIVQLKDGTKINFANTPTPEDVDFAYKKIQEQKQAIQPSTLEKPQGETGLKGIATGMGKGVLSTIKGGLQLGENIGQGILGGVEKLTGLPVTQDKVYTEEALQKNAEQGGAGKLLTEETLTPQTTAEKIGKTGEQIAEFAVPSNIVSKVTKGASLVGKIIPRALTSGSVASIQSGDIGMETAIASGIETALPIAGAILKPATKLVSGLFRNIGSGLAGVPSKTLKKISENPNTAQDTIKTIKEFGVDKVLKDNAETYINGVKKIKKEASDAYTKGLEALEKTDIKPDIIKNEIKSVIKDNKGVITDKGFSLKDVEFYNDKKLVKSASDLITAINNNKDLSGRGIKKIMDMADGMRLKTATTDTSISFNNFIDDISNGLKTAIGKSTNKLDEINAMYSKDINLANGIQSILGKVKYGIKNDTELNNIAKKIDTLFTKGGLSESELDKFLTRIGVSPEDFKTSEAIRQVSNIEAGASSFGTNRGEMLRMISGSIITPKLVRDLALMTGKTEQALKPILEKLKTLDPTTRASIIELILPNDE